MIHRHFIIINYDKLLKSLLRAIVATFGKQFMKCLTLIRLRIKINKLFDEHVYVFFCNALYIHSKCAK
jgi:hypothetical protein